MAPFSFLGTFFFCCDGLSWKCVVFRDIFLLLRWFVPVLWRFSGLFPSDAMVCPGIVGFFGTFLFRSGGLSRFCGAFQDISLLMRWFVLELCGFSGHFLSGAAVCPGFMAFFRTFSFRRGGLSWNCGVFRDISLLRYVLSRFYRPNKDVLLLPEDFLPESCCFSGHFPFAVCYRD